MCKLAYDLFGNIKRKRCKECTQAIERIEAVDWKPPFLIQHFSISPTYTVYYQRNVEVNSFRRQSMLPRKNKTDGSVSKKAARKIRYCFNWLVAASKIKQVYCKATGKTSYFKLNFITLTLSEKQKHSDTYVKDKMLSSFIQWLQRKHDVVSYIWKAEAQLNGNIHFHITTNKFIHWRQIRHKWNYIQFQHGYNRGMCSTDFITDTNSTDVKPVKNENALAGYMVKYLTKDDVKLNYLTRMVDENKGFPDNLEVSYHTDDDGLVWMGKRKIEGRLWYHSSNLFTTGFSIDETDCAYSDWRKVLNQFKNGAVIGAQYASVIPTRRIGIKEFPASVALLLRAKIATINASDKHTSLYVVDEL